MRAWLPLLCLTACGRLGFATTELLGDAAPTPDAPAADCSAMADGTPCDDRNICTASSSCQAGICASTAVTDCQVADSMIEFADTQGESGWFYGFWLVQDSPYDPDTDFELGVFANGSWEPVDPMGSGFIYLRGFGAHPQFDPVLRMPVRRWVSDVQGPGLVLVTVSKSDTSCGDGVIASLVVDGVEVMTKDIAFDDGDGATIPVQVELAIGTKVDALLSPRDGEACDTTDYALTITSAPTN